MMKKAVMLAFAAWVLTVSASFAAEDVRDYTWFLKRLYDLDGLTRLDPGTKCAQASSYDRASRYDAENDKYINWSANSDCGQYISIDPETGEALMADLKGPGCIFRIWSANPKGKIRFYIDGDLSPTYEFDFAKLFKGEYDPFMPPFVWNRAKDVEKVETGGNPASDCYLPIPYAKSCRVTADEAHEQYYHIGYQTYAPGTKVASFRLPLTPKERKALESARAKWNTCGRDPQPSTKAVSRLGRITVAPGERQAIANLKGPAVIKGLRIRVEDKKEIEARSLVLRAYWDGSTEPSIDTPIGEFFGESYGTPDYRSLPLGYAIGAGYCYWRMPFRKSAHIYVYNEGTTPVELTYETKVERKRIAADTLYFHAKWRRDKDSQDFDYPLLECAGRGKFVGVALYVDNVLGGWWGEGDEKAYVDGEKFPSTFGTGSEDYFGDAWNIRHLVNPMHGCPNSHDRIQCCYRWHIPDVIPFTKSFKFTIENYSTYAKVKNDYSSVTYWYQAEPSNDFFQPTTLVERTPLPPVIVPGAIEVENPDRATPPGAQIVEDPGFSNSKALRYDGPVGAIHKLPFDVKDGEICLIEVYESPKKPARFDLLIDGQPIVDKVRVVSGINTIEIRKRDAEPATVDYVSLTPWRTFIRDWAVVGPFPNPNDKTGLATNFGPEDDVRMSQTFKGKGGVDVTWTPATPDAEGLLDFIPLFVDNEDSLCYAATIVTSPDDRDCALMLGSDDGVRVWLNGKLVWDNPATRGVNVDEDRVPLKLLKGENVLLIKVENGKGGWGLTARFADPDGDLTYGVPK